MLLKRTRPLKQKIKAHTRALFDAIEEMKTALLERAVLTVLPHPGSAMEAKESLLLWEGGKVQIFKVRLLQGSKPPTVTTYL